MLERTGGSCHNQDINSDQAEVYVDGVEKAIAEAEKLGGIVGSNNRFVYEGQELIGKTTNSYCLENGSINAFGENTGIAGEECSTKTSSELKNLASTLGSAFKTDTNNINNGYPILSWQE